MRRDRCGETWSAGAARRGQPVRRDVVSRCGETWSAGAARRGQPVRRDVVSRCGETWSAGAARRGQPVRRDVVSRCGETWSAGAARRGQPVRRDVVSRCGETWSAGAARRGQPVRRDVVSRCRKRGQPVQETRSAGAGNAVNRCVERGQRVRRNTVFANVLKVLRTLPDLPDLPDLSRKGEREESRWRRALPLTRHAATGFSSTPDFLIVEPQPSIDDRGRRGALPRLRGWRPHRQPPAVRVTRTRSGLPVTSSNIDATSSLATPASCIRPSMVSAG